jgi:hypothetical protein
VPIDVTTIGDRRRFRAICLAFQWNDPMSPLAAAELPLADEDEEPMNPDESDDPMRALHE